MSKVFDEVRKANDTYVASFGDKGKLSLPPARRFAVLACMDARLDPAKIVGLTEGDAHVIRNAGGRATDDAIRSLVISHKLLGTQEWFVIHHTDCGMELFTDDVIAGLLEDSLKTATFTPETGWRNTHAGPGSIHGRFVKWHTFSNVEQRVDDDVKRIRSHPLVPGDIPVYGFYYDVRTGRLIEVAEASASGRPT